MQKIGFILASNILKSNQYLPSYAKGKSRSEIISAITRRIKSLPHNPKVVSSTENLATEIALAAEAWGVDPFIFSGLIDSETNYGLAILNSTGGDTGYTQMTSAGLSELRDQYLHKRNGPILMEFARKYFKSMSPDAFFKWVTRDDGDKHEKKRKELLSNTAYALAAGASLLKIYLSVPVVVAPYNNYNYEPHGYAYALALYNANRSVKPGETLPHYLLYSRKTRNNARKARDASLNVCGITPESTLDNNFSMGIIMSACELSQDQETCKQALDMEFVPNQSVIDI